MRQLALLVVALLLAGCGETTVRRPAPDTVQVLLADGDTIAVEDTLRLYGSEWIPAVRARVDGDIITLTVTDGISVNPVCAWSDDQIVAVVRVHGEPPRDSTECLLAGFVNTRGFSDQITVRGERVFRTEEGSFTLFRSGQDEGRVWDVDEVAVPRNQLGRR